MEIKDDISFKVASKEDSLTILNFIKGIAEYEKLSNEVKATKEDIEYALFTRNIGKAILLLKGNKPIGFALYFYNFSTFTGKCGIHLEDFFIYEKYRHNGYGKRLFKEVIKIAKKEGCPRLEWTCLKWNTPSMKFYDTMLGKKMDEWVTYRLTIDNYDEALKK